MEYSIVRHKILSSCVLYDSLCSTVLYDVTLFCAMLYYAALPHISYLYVLCYAALCLTIVYGAHVYNILNCRAICYTVTYSWSLYVLYVIGRTLLPVLSVAISCAVWCYFKIC